MVGQCLRNPNATDSLSRWYFDHMDGCTRGTGWGDHIGLSVSLNEILDRRMAIFKEESLKAKEFI